MAGNLIAPVEDGKIVETESQSSLKKANNKNSMYSKDTYSFWWRRYRIRIR